MTGVYFTDISLALQSPEIVINTLKRLRISFSTLNDTRLEQRNNKKRSSRNQLENDKNWRFTLLWFHSLFFFSSIFHLPDDVDGDNKARRLMGWFRKLISLVIASLFHPLLNVSVMMKNAVEDYCCSWFLWLIYCEIPCTLKVCCFFDEIYFCLDNLSKGCFTDCCTHGDSFEKYLMLL